MRIGILSDIHEAVELLEVAIGRLSAEGVDHLVVLGDVFETGPRMDETVGLLEASGAVGVYGNHDYGLCVDPSPFVVGRFSRPTLAFMGSLRPRMELAGGLFAHREPWLDCSDLAQIWHVEDEELAPSNLARSFAAEPDRPTFIGHYHQWRAFAPEGPLAWDGSRPLSLPADRPSLVVVAAICDGHAAVYDSEARVLTPVDLYRDRSRPDRRPLPPLVSD